MKICSKCKKDKELSLFPINKSGKNGISSVCKECKSEQHKIYYINNKIKIDNRNKNYNIINKDKIYKYYKNYESNRKLIDPLFKLKHNIRSLILCSFKNSFTVKSKKTVEILGCTFEEFKIHLEKQFDNKMTWNNQGSYWEMDHIIPLASATNEQEIIELNHYTNFQPLYWLDNILKRDKILNVINKNN